MKQRILIQAARGALAALHALAFAGGCAETKLSHSLQSNASDQSKQSSNCGKWSSFEGLSLIDDSGTKQSQGNLSCSKKAVIFVHGWTSGIPTAFDHSELWRAAGFNTFVFEWVELAQGNPLEIFTKNTAKAATKLVQAVQRLEQQIEDLDLQIVGHSFGSKVSIEAAVELAKPLQLLPAFQNRKTGQASEKSPNPLNPSLPSTRSGSAADLGDPINAPTNQNIFNKTQSTLKLTRLTLLDPATLLDLGLAAKLCERVTIRAGSSAEHYELASELKSKISLIKGFGTKIESYATNVAGLVSTSLAKQVPTLDMIVGCGLKQQGRSIVETHNAVVSDYFKSIAQASAPQLVDDKGTVIGTALSAATPTAQLPSNGVRYELFDKADSAKPMSEQRYKIQKGEPKIQTVLSLEPGQISATVGPNF